MADRSLYLRRAAEDDAILLYEWRNEEEVRKNSLQTGIIPYISHKEWFDRAVKDPARAMYVLMNDDKPVGQIRLDFSESGEEALISYSIDRDVRGRGWGTQIIRMAQEKVKEEYPKVFVMKAAVKEANKASLRVFEKCGYIESGRKDGIVSFEYVLPETE